MERQANYEVMREEWCAWEPSPALIEAVQQIEFKWDEDYTFKTNPSPNPYPLDFIVHL
jgi:hypothetical protein